MAISGKRSEDNGPKAEMDKIERATGLGRRTKKEGTNERNERNGSEQSQCYNVHIILCKITICNNGNILS